MTRTTEERTDRWMHRKYGHADRRLMKWEWAAVNLGVAIRDFGREFRPIFNWLAKRLPK